MVRIEALGSGVAGEVFKATVTEPKLNIPKCKFLQSPPAPVTWFNLIVDCACLDIIADNVAVKLVKEGMAAREDLLGEAALMALLDDTNIVRLVGVVTVPRDMVRSPPPLLQPPSSVLTAYYSFLFQYVAPQYSPDPPIHLLLPTNSHRLFSWVCHSYAFSSTPHVARACSRRCC